MLLNDENSFLQKIHSYKKFILVFSALLCDLCVERENVSRKVAETAKEEAAFVAVRSPPYDFFLSVVRNSTRSTRSWVDNDSARFAGMKDMFSGLRAAI